VTKAEELLEHVQGRAFFADAGYDSNHLRAAIRERCLKVVIASNPTRKRTLPKNRALYRLRVECFFHSLKR
jgi:IS5 family transposase